MIAVIFLLSATLARADVPDRFDSTKMSTESLALGVNTCADRFEASLKNSEKDAAAKRAGLITRHYCSCMMDATQALPEGKKLSKEHAKKCLVHAKRVVDGYLRGKSTEKESNLFDGKSLPTSSVYTMFLVCLKKHATERKDSPRYCGCVIDGVRTEPAFTPEDFVSEKKPLSPDWLGSCEHPN